MFSVKQQLALHKMQGGHFHLYVTLKIKMAPLSVGKGPMVGSRRAGFQSLLWPFLVWEL